MIGEKHSELVLAIQPFTRGYAFVLFEGPLSPIDWGIKEVRGSNRNARCLAAAETLMARMRPDILALEDFDGSFARRSRRIKRLQSLIANQAIGQSIDVRHYARECIRDCFKGVGAVTRYEIAQAIAAQVQAFQNRLPPVRRLWEPEDPRMALFDAASLVLTHYCALGSSDMNVE
jgi:Holliday junction resolvasome RuvABC endonuclease subunit